MIFRRLDRVEQPAVAIFREAMAPGRTAAHVFTLAMNILALTMPIYMLQVYDRVMSSGSERSLILLTVIAVFAMGIFAVLDALRGLLIGRRAAYAARLLARRVTAAVTERSRDPTIAIGPAMRDVEALRAAQTAPASTAGMDAPYAVIFFIMLGMLHWSFALLALVGAIALTVQAYWSDRLTSEPNGRAFLGQAHAARFADGAFGARDAVHAMGMAPAIAAKFLALDAKARDAQNIASTRESIFGAAGRVTRLLTQLGLLGLGAYLVLEQATSSGAMVTAGILGARALLPIENAVSGWRIIVSARQAGSRLDTLLRGVTNPALKSQIPGLKGDVQVENAFVVPPGGKAATLKQVSLTIPAGEFIGIVGPSGSGKSTLARLIAGAWQPQGGVVRLGGVDAQALAVEDRAKLVGFLPQDAQLMAGTIRDNVARLSEASMDAVTAAAHRARAHDLIVQLPNAYDTEIGPGGAGLSGGQRQRIALSRALFGAPKIVILDEPGTALDAAGEAALIETLRELKAAGVTLIVVSHTSGHIIGADRVLSMQDGMIKEILTNRQVMERIAARSPRVVAPEAAR